MRCARRRRWPAYCGRVRQEYVIANAYSAHQDNGLPRQRKPRQPTLARVAKHRPAGRGSNSPVQRARVLKPEREPARHWPPEADHSDATSPTIAQQRRARASATNSP
jgi:hypothetical protein